MRWILLAYLLMSVLTFIMYGVDKRRASHGGQRISESRLHWLELLFGWPGGLLGQSIFHHKQRKLRYLMIFWPIVILHAGVWCWWLIQR